MHRKHPHPRKLTFQGRWRNETKVNIRLKSAAQRRLEQYADATWVGLLSWSTLVSKVFRHRLPTAAPEQLQLWRSGTSGGRVITAELP